MQVKHFLPAAFAGVDLCFEAVRQAVCRGDLRHFQHHFRHQSRITALKVRQRIDVFFGISSKCTGAEGLMSLKHNIFSSSYTTPAGICLAAILQKIQSLILFSKGRPSEKHKPRSDGLNSLRGRF